VNDTNLDDLTEELDDLALELGIGVEPLPKKLIHVQVRRSAIAPPPPSHVWLQRIDRQLSIGGVSRSYMLHAFGRRFKVEWWRDQ
jgi:hypothetical protein